MATRTNNFTEDTSICVLWELGRGQCSYILSTVWICSIDFTLSQMCESAWNRPIAVGGFEGSFNANTKERYFVTISICPFQVYIEGRNRRHVRKYRAVCLSHVHCAWNCWGGGLIWARRLNARASHSYRGVWQTHVGGPLWKLDMRRRHCGCAKYSEIQNRQKCNYFSFATC